MVVAASRSRATSRIGGAPNTGTGSPALTTQGGTIWLLLATTALLALTSL